MAERDDTRRDYYVYVLFRPDTGQPFYVGMGKGERWSSHERRAKRRETHKDLLICQILASSASLPKIKVRQCLSKREAFEIEVALIRVIGRLPNGPLLNLTNGGDGVPGLPQEARDRIGLLSRQRLKGIPRSPEIIKKIKATKSANRQQISIKSRERWLSLSDEEKAMQISHLTSSNKGRKLSAERCAAISERLKGTKRSREDRAKISAGQMGHIVSLETREKISAAQRGRKLSDQQRCRISEIQRGKKLTEEHKAKIGKGSREAVMKKTFEERRATSLKAWATRRLRDAEREGQGTFGLG